MPAPSNTRFAVAVHALAYLAAVGCGRTVSSDELAASANVNPVHVRKVMGPLRESGLVSSRPGAHGGWELTRPGADIGLDEVWEALRGDGPVLGLHGPNPDCPIGRGVQSALVALDHDVAAALRRELATASVADMIVPGLVDATG